MGDPLSATASIMAVIQISGAVLLACYQYIGAVHDAPADIHRVISEVGSLKVVLIDLKTMAKDSGSELPALLKCLDA